MVFSFTSFSVSEKLENTSESAMTNKIQPQLVINEPKTYQFYGDLQMKEKQHSKFLDLYFYYIHTYIYIYDRDQQIKLRTSHVRAIIHISPIEDSFLAITISSTKADSRFNGKNLIFVKHNNYFYDDFQYPPIILNGD